VVDGLLHVWPRVTLTRGCTVEVFRRHGLPAPSGHIHSVRSTRVSRSRAASEPTASAALGTFGGVRAGLVEASPAWIGGGAAPARGIGQQVPWLESACWPDSSMMVHPVMGTMGWRKDLGTDGLARLVNSKIALALSDDAARLRCPCASLEWFSPRHYVSLALFV
jgi:hypothetical protein